MNFERSSGILLHPTSLPSKYGIGDLGVEAYKFIDFLILSGQKLWQVFPLGPTGYGDSPYQSFSAFAGNPLLISIDDLISKKLLTKNDIKKNNFSNSTVEYGEVINYKNQIFHIAFENFLRNKDKLLNQKFQNFKKVNSFWLKDYSLFRALKDFFKGAPWSEWDLDIKFRETKAIDKYSKLLEKEINYHSFLQYFFFEQWFSLKSYANKNNIKIIGDIPIFVAMDSSDAWSNPNLFQFDKNLNPTSVAGVPPDYFSETGQLWGNPLYNWDFLKDTKFQWWIKRVQSNFKMVDIVRIDHFRGFSAYWSVPFGEKTAINGSWIQCPGKELFNQIKNSLGNLSIIAEDLGVITEEVEELRDYFNFPGMKILQFAFNSSEESNHLPHLYQKNLITYTGTHDNDTSFSWFQNLSNKDKKFVRNYLDFEDESNVSWEMIKAAWSSVAIIAITPLQDLLNLGKEARMNTPGVSSNNWQWRFEEKYLTKTLEEKLNVLTKLYYR